MNEHDIKVRWRENTNQAQILPIEALHRRSLAFDRAIWRQDMAELMGCVTVVLAFGLSIRAAPNFTTRIGESLAILCAVVAAFQLRRHATTRPRETSTGAPLLAFHVAALNRRRDLLRGTWRWIVAPITISIWVIVAGFVQARPASSGPLLTFAGIMTLIGLVLSLANRRAADRLQRDIDALVLLGADSPSATNRS
jgi:hypothetical protein